MALNRMAVEYDHVLICGPVFPHEVAGFSGGTKYLFPGIAAPEIIHFTHWLGALITNHEMIGTIDTPVRRVIDRAARLLDRPLSLLAVVVTHEGVAGVFCGEPADAWRQAAMLSSRRHVIWVDQPYDRVLSVMHAVRLPLDCRQGHVQGGASSRRRRGASPTSLSRHTHGRILDETGPLRAFPRAVGSLQHFPWGSSRTRRTQGVAVRRAVAGSKRAETSRCDGIPRAPMQLVTCTWLRDHRLERAHADVVTMPSSFRAGGFSTGWDPPVV